MFTDFSAKIVELIEKNYGNVKTWVEFGLKRKWFYLQKSNHAEVLGRLYYNMKICHTFSCVFANFSSK